MICAPSSRMRSWSTSAATTVAPSCASSMGVTVPSRRRDAQGRGARRGGAARASDGRDGHRRARPRHRCPRRPPAPARPRRPTAGATPSHRRSGAPRNRERGGAQHPTGRRVRDRPPVRSSSPSASSSSDSARSSSAWRASTGTRSRCGARAQHRQHLVADPGSPPAHVGVRRVLDRRRDPPPRRRPVRRRAAGAAAAARRHRDAVPSPRARRRPSRASTLRSTVSAWSSAVWATRIAVAPSSAARDLQRAVPRVARPGLEVRARSRPRPAPIATARRATRRHAARRRRPRRCRPADRGPRAPRSAPSPARRQDQQGHRVGAAGARDHHRRDEPGEVGRRRGRVPIGRAAPASRSPAPDQPTATAPTRRSQVVGRVELGQRRQVLGRSPRRVERRGTRRGRVTACDEGLADLVLAHLHLEAHAVGAAARWRPRALRRCASTAAIRACPSTRRAPRWFITALP